MTITIRHCRTADRRGCEQLFRDAFWDLYRPGCVEHLIAHQAWESSQLSLALLAVQDDALRGCLIATQAEVVAQDERHPVSYLGPLGVLPAWQGRGIGSALVRQALAELSAAGAGGVFLYGDPDYYARFGFQNAARWQVSTPTGDNFDAFMGLELRPGALAGVTGRLQEGEVFDFAPDAVADFDATFEPREAHVLPGQFGQ